MAGTVDIDTVITRAEHGDAGSQYAFGFLYRVGRTSARAEVTVSGAGRLCDKETLVRSAARGCIKKPSGAGKMGISDQTPADEFHP